MAASLEGVSPENVTVNAITLGSVIVDFSVAVTPSRASTVRQELDASTLTVQMGATSTEGTVTVTREDPGAPSPSPSSDQEKEQEEKTDTATFIFIGLGVMVAIFLTVMILFLIYSKTCGKKPDAKASGTGGANNPVPVEPYGGTSGSGGPPTAAAYDGAVNQWQLGGYGGNESTPAGYYQPPPRLSEWVMHTDASTNKQVRCHPCQVPLSDRILTPVVDGLDPVLY
eukprot:SAG31_NODE_13140_length_890_cov_1.638432_1_plen_227_part_01